MNFSSRTGESERPEGHEPDDGLRLGHLRRIPAPGQTARTVTARCASPTSEVTVAAVDAVAVGTVAVVGLVVV